MQGRRARRVLALPPGLPGEPRERDGARRRRLDRGPRGPARRRRRARRGRHLPRRPAAAAVFTCVLFVFATSAAMACCFRGPDDSATTRDILPYHTPSTRSNPPTLCTQAGDAAVERARRRARRNRQRRRRVRRGAFLRGASYTSTAPRRRTHMGKQ